MAPVMEWTKYGIELNASISNGVIYNDTHSEVTSKLCVKADSSLHNSKYSCKCYFNQSCCQAGTSECKVPDYQYTWTSPILLVKRKFVSSDLPCCQSAKYIELKTILVLSRIPRFKDVLPPLA